MHASSVISAMIEIFLTASPLNKFISSPKQKNNRPTRQFKNHLIHRIKFYYKYRMLCAYFKTMPIGGGGGEGGYFDTPLEMIVAGSASLDLFPWKMT